MEENNKNLEIENLNKKIRELKLENAKLNQLLDEQCNKVIYLVTKYHLPFDELKKENNLGK